MLKYPTLDASYPGGTTMHSDDNRCAIAKDFFNTNLELLQSVNYMPTSLLEILFLGLLEPTSILWGLYFSLPPVFAMVDCCVDAWSLLVPAGSDHGTSSETLPDCLPCLRWLMVDLHWIIS